MEARWLARGEPQLPPGLGWLSTGERKYADSKPFTKRRVEFLVARWAFKTAVTLELGLGTDDATLAGIEARHLPDGAPRLFVGGAPAAYDVSMTDRAGWAVSVLTPSGSDVGCDLELVEPRTDAFVADYLTAREQEAVADAARRFGAEGRDLAANLIWSAKESALKVLHTGLRSDTRSVEVTVPEVTAAERTWSPLSVRTAAGATFPGWWRRTGDFVLTTCARTPLGLPESLDDPPALDLAQPLHSWLANTRVGATT